MVWRGEVDVITHAINATDPATALEHSLYTRHPDSLDGGYWGVGPVTLVGDAAHPMRPTGMPLMIIIFCSYVCIDALGHGRP